MTAFAIFHPFHFGFRSGLRLRLRENEQRSDLSTEASGPQAPKQPPKLPSVVPPSLRSSGNPPSPPSPPYSARPPLPPRPPSRVKGRANWLADRLTDRDWAILATLYRLNSATIGQLYRLHFDGLTMRNCQYVMRRLLDWHAVSAMERRMGGVLSGSGQRVFFLDASAHRLMRLAEGHKELGGSSEIKPGRWSHRHSLTIAELYVQCVESARRGGLDLSDFVTEPACWWPDGNGGFLRPDAYLKVAVPESSRRQHWWIEIDLGTESTPTVRAKFETYLQFIGRNASGPDGAIPRILVTVEDESRSASLTRLVSRMGDDATRFIHVAPFGTAVSVIGAFARATEREPE